MAHLSYSRRAIVTRSLSLERVRPLNARPTNFAAFCGTPQQRRAVGLQAIAGFCGSIGIVVIHDDDMIESQIARLPQILGTPSLTIHSSRGRVYDPLYGMTANGIADLLAPKTAGSPYANATDRLRSGIFAYLQIMDYQFRVNPTPFGRYPYNLNLLFQMSAMPYNVLYDSIIRYLPENVRLSVNNILNQTDIQREVHAVVLSLARSLEEHLWVNRGFGEHTGLSIIDSVKQRNVICIRVPDSLPSLLEYIDAELQTLSNENIPMLIVSCGINLKNCTSLKSRFLPEHSKETIYTGIISPTLSSLTDNQNETSCLFSRYPQIFVFQCDSASQAEPFSAALGTYLRTETEHTDTVTRQPFKIFGARGHVVADHFKEERNIRPEDLYGLHGGVMLCGSAYEIPQIVNRFIINGGVNNGLLLS